MPYIPPTPLKEANTASSGSSGDSTPGIIDLRLKVLQDLNLPPGDADSILSAVDVNTDYRPSRPKDKHARDFDLLDSELSDLRDKLCILAYKERIRSETRTVDAPVEKAATIDPSAEADFQSASRGDHSDSHSESEYVDAPDYSSADVSTVLSDIINGPALSATAMQQKQQAIEAFFCSKEEHSNSQSESGSVYASQDSSADVSTVISDSVHSILEKAKRANSVELSPSTMQQKQQILEAYFRSQDSRTRPGTSPPISANSTQEKISSKASSARRASARLVQEQHTRAKMPTPPPTLEDEVRQMLDRSAQSYRFKKASPLASAEMNTIQQSSITPALRAHRWKNVLRENKNLTASTSASASNSSSDFRIRNVNAPPPPPPPYHRKAAEPVTSDIVRLHR
ncbi:hypothetical protein BZA70DRAFT_267500 [Myxozyma melibiosi]|uniref:Uncharacterized protein n=1 Tax=Myxozyma melibiosi TaxID=54550 RepID=A0ABR1F576_9ASCO